ncbi:HelD family protein [Nocardiopsis metallicus]|uniref:DNA helicase IV n=1 Tax=Nocardiopsis metallicus TaxID=179819 RepID=A0A840VYX3_9ACTN|nr:ATP-binding domain-containing protein [Nocardiopsis metallicus]MBB5489649.1 DNA helicase IV [Nocardiopsis metallicus]
MDSCQSDSSAPSPEEAAIAVEQARVSVMYERLDTLRAQTEQRLIDAHLQERSGYAAIVERETRSYEHARRRAQLSSVEEGLCFGRIDISYGPDDTEARYVGRIGLRDTEHDTILVDWRAPAARPFYAATPSDPEGITRRRHLRVRSRRVFGLDDEVFDADGLSEGDRRQLVGEAALLASLHRGRTGRMADIVATIQAEQDRVIRAQLAGVLVVQGGPGTGKTVAALHRAAYLLYTHRRILERRGVLVVGPNPAFLRYVGNVLPSLGETDVVMRTVGELFPGVEATARDRHATAVLKGSPRMVDFVGAAVRDRQRSPLRALGEADLRVETDAGTLVVPADVCAHVLETTRNLKLPHNTARKYLVNTLLTELARAESQLLGRPATEEDLPHTGARLWHEAPVQQALDALWPDLTPQRVLRDLYADPEALALVGAEAGVAEAGSMARHPEAPWTVEDVPLLDEVAELLGQDDSLLRARQRQLDTEREEEVRYAQGVLDFTGLTEDPAEGLDAVTLAARHRDSGPNLTTADRAGADRTWSYGHVIVDEAQELSPMAWRAVMRRVPTRSLTVVGDVAQTGSAAGTSSWQGSLEEYAPGKVHVEHLRVNYRTPAPIMAVAADVLREAAPGQQIPESVREEGEPPRAVRLTGLGGLPALVDEERAAVGEGRIAVVTSDASLSETSAALPGAGRPGTGTDDELGDTVVVLTATESKGLEFDSVIVVRPEELLAQPRGANDLYVALTRATKRLTVAHEADLPGLLKRLEG